MSKFNNVKKRYDNAQLRVWGCAPVRSHGHHLFDHKSIEINLKMCSKFSDNDRHHIRPHLYHDACPYRYLMTFTYGWRLPWVNFLR